ncbi:MAG: hypothetical protein HY260_02460 [Chloroflexi bacterium]|nr:hypothetical protein [Chloroflexota bacterium]
MPFDQTPLFQLNLMIFLAWPSAPAFVRPVLREGGFALHAIGPPIPTTLQTQARAANATPPIPLTPTPSPDLLFSKAESKTLMPMECKLSSFGPEAKQARQAAALLSCISTHLADILGLATPGNWSAMLVYAVRDGFESLMQDTLSSLTTRLNSALVETVPFGSLGIAVRSDGVYLVPEPRAALPISALMSAPTDGVRVMPLEEGEDPRPLYLVPLDPAYQTHDDYEKRALEERVRTALASLVGSRLDQVRFEVALDDILRAAVEVWDAWADRNAKKNIRNAVRAYARQVLQQIRKLGLDINVDQDRIIFQHISPSTANEVRRYFSSAGFRQGRIDLWSEAVQLDFSSLAEGW